MIVGCTSARFRAAVKLKEPKPARFCRWHRWQCPKCLLLNYYHPDRDVTLDGGRN